MIPRLLLLALFLFTVPAGALEGRRANDLFDEGSVEEAILTYREGLLRSEGETGTVRAGLFNNLGVALYEQEDFAGAQTAFEQSLAVALAPEDRARAAFNAGNAAAQQQNFEAALGFYRQALLVQPDFPEAAFNYEYLKRQQQDQPQQPDSENIQPSPFAEQLKAQADSLVAAEQYRAALETMQQGLLADSTVQAYSDFVGRLGAVVEIDETNQP